MKISLYALAQVKPAEIGKFYELTKWSREDMEKYVGTLLNKYNLVYTS